MIRHSSCVKVALAMAFALAACSGSIGGSAGPGAQNNPAGNGAGSGSGNGAGSVSAEKPGRTPMRRLTHDEYNRTVRDLLGLSDDFAGAFSGDEESGGFAANTISPVSDDEADQYHTAADAIATKAVAAGLDKIVPCAGAGGDSCATDFIRSFGRRAFRRPLTDEEVARYRGVFTSGGGTGDFAGGVQLVLTAMLQSPHFLYLPEVGDKGAQDKDGLPLDPFETAARLSYFVIGSTPDDELSAAADAGGLRTADDLAKQARRLLGTGKARDSMASFYLQWLEAADMTTLDKDPKMFPQFSPALRQAMGEELAAFGTHVTLDEGGQFTTLLTAGYSYPNAALATLYGVSGGNANGSSKVDLPAGQRAGLFTLAGVMALYAQPDQSRPVGRGYLVADKLLCNTPPPAPPNVVTTLPPPDPSITTRERLEKHRSDPTCASCHALFDPFGLTFEIYDAVGAYRTQDGKKAVDASGKGLPAGVPDVKDATGLMAELAKRDDVRNCLVKQWFRYALGRMESGDDAATLTAAQEAFAGANFKVPDLLVAIATSRGFRYRALPQ